MALDDPYRQPRYVSHIFLERVFQTAKIVPFLKEALGMSRTSNGIPTSPIANISSLPRVRSCESTLSRIVALELIFGGSLIWNLLLGGRTAIEHVLRSHYRAITDINWHTIEPDVVISTGIDSWQWAWDLRTVHKPIMGETRPPSSVLLAY